MPTQLVSIQWHKIERGDYAFIPTLDPYATVLMLKRLGAPPFSWELGIYEGFYGIMVRRRAG
jgi:hypothetical protein